MRWLANEPPNLEEAREAATNTVLEANRASDVIGRIRALLKKEPSRMERLDFNELIREVLTRAKTEIENGNIEVDSELNPAPLPVFGDRVQLQQVILNLVFNAIEAMHTVKDRKRELHIISTADLKVVQVSVEDTGVGFGREDLERIFHPFYTTKRDGIGMGLSISRSIIEAHGGRIWAAPSIPFGAVFHFSLPKANGV